MFFSMQNSPQTVENIRIPLGTSEFKVSLKEAERKLEGNSKGCLKQAQGKLEGSLIRACREVAGKVKARLNNSVNELQKRMNHV